MVQKASIAAGETFGRETDPAWIETGEGNPPPTRTARPKAPAVADSAGDGATGRIPFAGIRGAVARNMAAARQKPRVTAGVRVEMSACLTLEEKLCCGRWR